MWNDASRQHLCGEEGFETEPATGQKDFQTLLFVSEYPELSCDASECYKDFEVKLQS